MRDNTDVYGRIADWLGGSIDSDDTITTAAGVPLLRSDVQTVLTDVTAAAEHRDRLLAELVQQAKDHVRTLNVAAGFDQDAMRERVLEAEARADTLYESRQEERAAVARLTSERDALAWCINDAPHGVGCAATDGKPGACDCWKAAPQPAPTPRANAAFALHNLVPRGHQPWILARQAGFLAGIATADMASMVADDVDEADIALIVRLCHPDTIAAIIAVLTAPGDAHLNAAADRLAATINTSTSQKAAA
ncbi:hypothetical protein [Curtobacterium sp. MCBD17_040]|uniref:hypothetical protein n=1 Tax=Curtobacterium sp. MCBD17_040 TaxID=2175674 RepID=UPI000DA722CF|nr:hypothetical protein [Curtobacterium sp. MCBD17_040]WIB65282.1 hypothetical protein DEI94_17915 [Curtobacterium sp. MCBD17_040]